MTYRFTSKAKTARLRQIILGILEVSLDPLSSRDISYKVESQTRYRCSVYSVGNILRPLVESNEITKIKIVGENRYTYQLN